MDLCNRCAVAFGRAEANANKPLGMTARPVYPVTFAGIPAVLCAPCIGGMHEALATGRLDVSVQSFLKWVRHG